MLALALLTCATTLAAPPVESAPPVQATPEVPAQAPIEEATTGALKGVAADEGGIALPGVLLTLTGAALDAPRQQTSGVDGRWRFSDLPPGDYALTATKPYFTPYAAPEIAIQTGDERALFVALEVGESSADDCCCIIDEPPAIEADRAWRGLSQDSDALDRLPR